MLHHLQLDHQVLSDYLAHRHRLASRQRHLLHHYAAQAPEYSRLPSQTRPPASCTCTGLSPESPGLLSSRVDYLHFSVNSTGTWTIHSYFAPPKSSLQVFLDELPPLRLSLSSLQPPSFWCLWELLSLLPLGLAQLLVLDLTLHSRLADLRELTGRDILGLLARNLVHSHQMLTPPLLLPRVIPPTQTATLDADSVTRQQTHHSDPSDHSPTRTLLAAYPPLAPHRPHSPLHSPSTGPTSSEHSDYVRLAPASLSELSVG